MASNNEYEQRGFWDNNFLFTSDLTIDPSVLVETISDADYLINFTYKPSEDSLPF